MASPRKLLAREFQVPMGINSGEYGIYHTYMYSHVSIYACISHTALECLLSKLSSCMAQVQLLQQWLERGETQMESCGSIGADLPRLLVQAGLLESLDEDVLENKQLPEAVLAAVLSVLKECREGSGGEMMALVRALQARFDHLSNKSMENKELCEEATAEMQGMHIHVHVCNI